MALHKSIYSTYLLTYLLITRKCGPTGRRDILPPQWPWLLILWPRNCSAKTLYGFPISS